MNQFSPPKYIRNLYIKYGENPFVLLSKFIYAARRQKWTKEEIERVISAAKKGNYVALIRILRSHTNLEE
ncbi:hypothetical protein BS636_14560 [Acinetobacter sp. LoGeW2-3]|uniref:hypothetical protein n=1 Tax=Acinetobacter sp. LoGeW2-3 TaxID=1808001 RepID=UPI000C058DFA|nr:hypothetical protein [Acinetobacter sp. LoGeW2-3]ATO20816.1 hypothetical protein BS636_14560 [Acinetobacter sp. LoGeW2-3]